METEYLLNVGLEIATAEFESFCTRGLSLSSLVRSERHKTGTALVQFGLKLLTASGNEDARVEFRPARAGQCILDFNPSYTRSGDVLQDEGLIISEMLYCDFVLYLGQRGYLSGSANTAHEPRKQSIAELRQLVSKLARHVSELRAKHQAERDSLPMEGAPDFKRLISGVTSLLHGMEQGTLDKSLETLNSYLEVYVEFPQLATSETAPRSQQKGTLQLAAPGRPRKKAYDTAFDSIQSGRKTSSEAFEAFCQNQGIQKPNKQTRDSFKAAMKRRSIT